MSRANQKACAWRRRLTIQQLDARLCLAADIQFDAGVLTILGSPESDSILVRDEGAGGIVVEGAGIPRQSFQGVTAVQIDAGAGDDVVRFTRSSAATTALPTLDILAGEGNDDVALLLPAVQKIREAASRAQVSVDLGAGNDRLNVNARGWDGVDLDISAGDGDDNVVALLLPAVQKVREAAARAHVDLGAGSDVLRVNSSGFDQTDLHILAGDGDDNVVALLLPAVQKVREAAARMHVDLGAGNDRLQATAHGMDQANLDIVAGEGDDDVVALLLPAVQKIREAAARATVAVDLGAGNDRVNVQSNGIAQVDLDITAGDGDDVVRIGLLLPAVQKVRESAARVSVDFGVGQDTAEASISGFEAVDAVFTAADDEPQVNVRRIGRPNGPATLVYRATSTARS